MLTPEEIIADLKTDRVKKCILDSDMFCEIDDQYALAYCLGSDKIDLLSVNAVHFYNPYLYDNLAVTTDLSYDEALRVLDACGVDVKDCPVYKGAKTSISESGERKPVDSPAAQNIIKTVKESDEIIYVLSTGPCTSVVSAYMMDPSIADNMCVLWLGCQCLDIPNGLVEECNLNSDFLAGQLLLDLDIPLVLLPCQYNGSIKVVMNYNDFMNIDGDSKGAELFREGYPLKYVRRENFQKYTKVMCDLVAPASIALNDSMTYSIVTAPGLTDDLHYIFDESRRKIVYMENPDSRRIIDDAIKSINRITKGNK